MSETTELTCMRCSTKFQAECPEVVVQNHIRFSQIMFVANIETCPECGMGYRAMFHPELQLSLSWVEAKEPKKKEKSRLIVVPGLS